MSFNGYKSFIEEGDRAIVFLGINSFYTIRVHQDAVFQTKYGALRHNDILRRRWGSLVNCSKGWAYILHPTPELWTLSLPHRTQILYTPDISLVTLQLELRPGSVVFEAGTGSGSLSHALARTILPNGHLFTFDFHEGRAARAKTEFDDHGLGDVVTTGHRDVIKDGFGEELDGRADAVFLDLPLPWGVISAAKKAIKTQGGRICSFSPCIEQVQKTCLALAESGFTEISTQECIQRPIDVRPTFMPKLVLTPKPVPAPQTTEETQQPEPEVIKPDTEAAQSDLMPKNVPDGVQDNLVTEDVKLGDKKAPELRHQRRKRKFMTTGPSISFTSAVPQRQTVGHTGYLTFATLYSTM